MDPNPQLQRTSDAHALPFVPFSQSVRKGAVLGGPMLSGQSHYCINKSINEKEKSKTMIETTLDYEKVLAGRGNEVNLAVRINAPHLASKERKPVAFAICLDRSGSMQGEKFKQALKACTGIVQNLRPDDLFALTTFDDSAEVVLPLQKVSNKNHLIKVIGELHTRGCTNLSGGWSLARDELDKAEPGIPRRMLLLSDGIANVGVTDNESLLSYAGCGLEKGNPDLLLGIRRSLQRRLDDGDGKRLLGQLLRRGLSGKTSARV